MRFILIYILCGLCLAQTTEITQQTNINSKTPFNDTDIQAEYQAIQPPPIASKTALAHQNFFTRFKIYEPWYIIPAYYSFSKMYSHTLQKVDFKSQISFRLELLDNVLCEFCSFSFDYTQKIYLQTYNSAQSSPLRDIDLSPQLSFIYKKPLYLGGNSYINWLSIAYTHVSNGEDDKILVEDSRNTVRSKALDRIIFAASYKNGNFTIQLRLWAIISVFDGKTTNPDIGKYIGYGDIKLAYQYRDHLIEFTVNNIVNNYFNREYWNFKGNVEIDYSYGITKHYAIFLQYLVGHGDSLYEYSLPVNRIGIGIRLRDF
ncbi:phospholipase A [Helicobacter aurati]|uniref:phospholipase A n=1 Tax=Helicobacter aurati TaxID=137778 RepID=UPI001F311904|nr:phospholipase A [Helicobacter aurati]